MADNTELKYGKKEVKLSKVVNSSLFQWSFTSGGELPDGLRGRFTSVKEAVKALEQAQRLKDTPAPKEV